jgi:hypothetical protein
MRHLGARGLELREANPGTDLATLPADIDNWPRWR